MHSNSESEWGKRALTQNILCSPTASSNPSMLLKLLSRVGLKNLSITKRRKKKETKAVDTEDLVHLLLRLIFGLVSCMYGIISVFSENGSGAEAIFAFAIAWYLLKPIVKDIE